MKELFMRNEGFSLLELLITVLLIGILLALAIPFFNYLMALIRLNLATFALSQQWKITRFDATGSGSSPLTLCMTDTDESILFYPIQGDDCQSVTTWHSLPTGVRIDTANSTLRTVEGVAGNNGAIYRVSWADTRGGLGGSWGQLGRLVLVAEGTNTKRCLVLFSTDGSWNLRKDNQCNR